MEPVGWPRLVRELGVTHTPGVLWGDDELELSRRAVAAQLQANAADDSDEEEEEEEEDEDYSAAAHAAGAAAGTSLACNRTPRANAGTGLAQAVLAARPRVQWQRRMNEFGEDLNAEYSHLLELQARGLMLCRKRVDTLFNASGS
jgi:hypothetical protein